MKQKRNTVGYTGKSGQNDGSNYRQVVTFMNRMLFSYLAS